jgi:D-alanine--poly(phosphoribitol) ligase subunit 1
LNIIANIDRWAKITPDHPAHICEGRITTYQELIQKSDWLAAYLNMQLPDDHSPVAVQGHKENEMLIAFLGIIKSGHPYIPVDTTLPEKRVKSILEISKSQLMLNPESIHSIIEQQAKLNPSITLREINPEDPWYILFTSGSTGEPKGVVLTTGCLDTYLNWTLAEQKYKEKSEIILNQAPFSFDMSVMDIYCSWITGGTVFSLTRDEVADPPRMYQTLYSSQISVWSSTPSFVQMCLVEPSFSQGSLPNLYKFLFLGETLSPETAARVQERFPKAEIWNTYGPTEATVATTSILIDKNILEKYSPLPIGYPTLGCRTPVLKQDLSPAAEGERGEIIIVGGNVSPGYLGRPDLTERAFFKYEGLPAYHTGDNGHIQDGMLFYDGRMDNQVKFHGYRIELGDIEANLRDLPAIQDAVVIPILSNGTPESLAAFVILKEYLEMSDFEKTRMLKKELNQRLPSYMVPRKFVFLKQFPMNLNGKTDRKKLVETLS